MNEQKFKNKLLEYEYFLIGVINPLDKETHKIKFDSKKEFKHIKKIIDKIYFNNVKGFNELNFSYDDNFIYLTLIKEVIK